jgi:hypothetical protein
MEVPSNWQLELLGRVGGEITDEGNRDVPVYTNIKYPFDPVRLQLGLWHIYWVGAVAHVLGRCCLP